MTPRYPSLEKLAEGGTIQPCQYVPRSGESRVVPSGNRRLCPRVPGSVWPRPSRAGIVSLAYIVRVRLPTSSFFSPNDRMPITGFLGLTLISATGQSSRECPLPGIAVRWLLPDGKSGSCLEWLPTKVWLGNSMAGLIRQPTRFLRPYRS